MAMRPHVLLIGAGGYGGVYLREMTGHDAGADVVGVCETDPEIEQKVPVLRERNIPVYSAPEDFTEKTAPTSRSSPRPCTTTRRWR